MAYVGYFKTEKNSGAKSNGWLWLDTTINVDPDRITRQLATGSIQFTRDWGSQNIYCHQNAAPEPVSDGHILTSTFDDLETTYSGATGYIKSFTSSTGFFTKDVDLGVCPEWTIYFNAKNTGVDRGYIGYITFEFYKRNALNNDTFLFSVEYNPITSFYSFIGYTVNVQPTGSVTTSDRLRIRVKMGQKVPT